MLSLCLSEPVLVKRSHLYIKFGTGRFQSWGGGPNALLERSDAVFSAYNPGEEGGTALWELITVRKASFLAPLLDLSKNNRFTKTGSGQTQGKEKAFSAGCAVAGGQAGVILVRKTASFFEFSLCLSRACLGKTTVFRYKWLKTAVFRRYAIGWLGWACPCPQH